jgi:hypothetical protein
LKHTARSGNTAFIGSISSQRASVASYW